MQLTTTMQLYAAMQIIMFFSDNMKLYATLCNTKTYATICNNATYATICNYIATICNYIATILYATMQHATYETL